MADFTKKIDVTYSSWDEDLITEDKHFVRIVSIKMHRNIIGLLLYLTIL